MTTHKTFTDLGVRAPLVSVLAARGITDPFPIQVETLPDSLGGRDVLGRGNTGSGKTLAFDSVGKQALRKQAAPVPGMQP